MHKTSEIKIAATDASGSGMSNLPPRTPVNEFQVFRIGSATENGTRHNGPMLRLTVCYVRPDHVAPLKAWFRQLETTRRPEALATLVGETVSHERAILLTDCNPPILVYAMEVADPENLDDRRTPASTPSTPSISRSRAGRLPGHPHRRSSLTCRSNRTMVHRRRCQSPGDEVLMTARNPCLVSLVQRAHRRMEGVVAPQTRVTVSESPRFRCCTPASKESQIDDLGKRQE